MLQPREFDTIQSKRVNMTRMVDLVKHQTGNLHVILLRQVTITAQSAIINENTSSYVCSSFLFIDFVVTVRLHIHKADWGAV